MSSVRRRKGILLRCIHDIPSPRRNSTRIHLLQQNGVAERKNRHILEVARAMLNENHMWTTSRVDEVTRHEKYHGMKPNLSHARIFGSISYVHIPDEKRQKLDPKSEKCILIAYSLEQKGYRCSNPFVQKVHVSRDVLFDESASWYALDPTPPGTSTNDLDNTKDHNQLSSIPDKSPILTRLSWPQEPPSARSTSRSSPKMDKGKAKMLEYEDDPSDDNESTRSLDSAFGANGIMIS